MKWLFFILLAANLALALWGQFGKKESPNLLARQQIHPEKIRIAQPQTIQPQPPPIPQSAPPPVKKVCYKWGTFSGDALEKARAALKTLVPSGTVREQILRKPDKLGYWAYIPPKRTKQEALDAIGTLDDLGIRDHFLIQDNGKWQYAISLGIFRTEEAARKYASSIRSRGVKSATSGRRDSGEIVFSIDDLEETQAVRIEALHGKFPGSEMKEVDCD